MGTLPRGLKESAEALTFEIKGSGYTDRDVVTVATELFNLGMVRPYHLPSYTPDNLYSGRIWWLLNESVFLVRGQSEQIYSIHIDKKVRLTPQLQEPESTEDSASRDVTHLRALKTILEQHFIGDNILIG